MTKRDESNTVEYTRLRQDSNLKCICKLFKADTNTAGDGNHIFQANLYPKECMSWLISYAWAYSTRELQNDDISLTKQIR